MTPTIDKSNDSGVQRNEVFLVHLGCFTLTRVRTGALAPATERPEVWP